MKILCILIMIVISMNGCVSNKEISDSKLDLSDEKIEIDIDESKDFNVEDTNIASWLVYWDMDDAINEVYNSEELDSVNIFSVNFNEDYSFNMSGNIRYILDNIKGSEKEVYITVVNDVFKSDGTAIQKSSDFITELLLNESIKEKNINDLVELAVDLDVVGIDLDYENINDDLWEEYLEFINDLGERLSTVDKKLRVVLEMDAPIDKFNFPNKYEYIVMAYDLHGFGTDAGPKIDKENIEMISKKLNDYIEKPRIAFSLGGFSFNDNGTTIALSKSSIEKILLNNNITPDRDQDSDALTFTYNNCEIWYSDKETIKEWMTIAFQNGISNFDFWYIDKDSY